MEPYFLSMTFLPILRRIQRPTTQGHSSHAKYENSRKIETYRNEHFQRIFFLRTNILVLPLRL